MSNPASRSQDFFNADGISGLTHRAFTAAMGYDSADMARPLIGICNTFSELNHCNSHLRTICEAVKRGVLEALIERTDRAIDGLVYRLYGLSGDEVGVVES